MNDPVHSQTARRLDEVLLGYLAASRLPGFPGCDGLTTNDALRQYPRLAALGQVPGVTELQDRHPDLTNELERFFAHN